jgi:tight adherence protein C
VEAGLNLTGAIKQAMDKGPPGALRNEFQMITRDLRAGVPRADALRRMENRLNMKAITSFVGTVIQAEKMGASVGAALRVQSQQRRIERFQRAEKLAMEAPVKLILPLIAFIFPVTFIVLAFPIVVKFMQEGML